MATHTFIEKTAFSHCHLYLTDGKTEAQRVEVNYPRLYSYWWQHLDLNPCMLVSIAYTAISFALIHFYGSGRKNRAGVSAGLC
jgi:hypothetical protein